MNAKKIISITTGFALVASMAAAIPAFAQVSASVSAPVASLNASGSAQGHRMGGMRGPGMMKPGVFGTVTAVSGNSITINGRQGFGTSTPAVAYTIDATNATVKKNNATSTVSSIAVGDTIFAQGTITGTNVAATSIRDGVMMMGMRGKGGPGMNGTPGAPSSAPVLGNGQPVVAGTVSAVNGSSLTVTTASNVTYTVDASSAKVLQDQTASTLSSVAVGNKVVVQGTVNGTSVTASTVIDQSASPSATTAGGAPQARGFFASISNFFTHMFGF